MNMLAKDKKSPPKVEVSVKPSLKDSNKKKEVEDHQFKLARFKNVESKVKPMMSNPGAHWYPTHYYIPLFQVKWINKDKNLFIK